MSTKPTLGRARTRFPGTSGRAPPTFGVTSANVRADRTPAMKLAALISTSMGRAKERWAAGPFLQHFCDGQYEPELYTTPGASCGSGSRWRAPSTSPRSIGSDALRSRNAGGPLSSLKAVLSESGVSANGPLDREIDCRRWRPCHHHGDEQVVLQAGSDMLWASLAQARCRRGHASRTPCGWRAGLPALRVSLAELREGCRPHLGFSPMRPRHNVGPTSALRGDQAESWGEPNRRSDARSKTHSTGQVNQCDFGGIRAEFRGEFGRVAGRGARQQPPDHPPAAGMH